MSATLVGTDERAGRLSQDCQALGRYVTELEAMLRRVYETQAQSPSLPAAPSYSHLGETRTHIEAMIRDGAGAGAALHDALNALAIKDAQADHDAAQGVAEPDTPQCPDGPSTSMDMDADHDESQLDDEAPPSSAVMDVDLPYEPDHEAPADATTAPGTSMHDAMSTQGLLHTIDHADMGHRLPETVAGLVARPDFKNIVSVTNVPSVEVDESTLKKGSPDYTGVRLVASRSPGVYRLHVNNMSSPASAITEDRAVNPARPGDACQAFEDLLEDGLTGTRYYWCGTTDDRSSNTLYAGEKLDDLRRLNQLEAANEPYYHVGERGSGTAFHREDASWRSCNIIESGVKIWLLIAPDSTGDFEKLVAEHLGSPPVRCEQWVRHKKVIMAPSHLRERGIKLDVICSGPGDMVVTRPGQYHAVLNYTKCICRSINLLLPGEALFPLGPPHVCDDCGLSGLPPHMVQNLQPPPRPHGRAALPSRRLVHDKGPATGRVQKAIPLRRHRLAPVLGHARSRPATAHHSDPASEPGSESGRSTSHENEGDVDGHESEHTSVLEEDRLTSLGSEASDSGAVADREDGHLGPQTPAPDGDDTVRAPGEPEGLLERIRRLDPLSPAPPSRRHPRSDTSAAPAHLARHDGAAMQHLVNFMPTFRHFAGLITAANRPGSLPVALPQHPSILEAFNYSMWAERGQNLFALRTRVGQYALYHAVMANTAGYRKNADFELLRRLAADNRIECTSLVRSYNKGKTWNSLVGQYRGLLAFVGLSDPTVHISETKWMALKKSEMAEINEVLESAKFRRFREAGDRLIEYVVLGRVDQCQLPPLNLARLEEVEGDERPTVLADWTRSPA